MINTDLEPCRLPGGHRRGIPQRLWREWCFCRAVFRHFRLRLALMLLLLLTGGLLFRLYEPEKGHSLARATYYTWSLIFGEPPEEFPEAPVLQALFFVVPVLGLLIILEGIVEFALMLRDRRRNERGWCRIMADSYANHIILVGLGKLGWRSFRLLRQLGEDVVVIERNGGNQFLEEVRRDGSPLLVGDARREALLEEANAARARSIILATNNDLANLEIALDARRINPKIHLVLRMFDQNMADKLREGFDLPMAMSQSAISAPAFVMAALEGSIVGSLVVDDQLVIMQRWQVRRDGPLCGRTVGEIIQEYGVGVIERRTEGEPARLMPPPDTRLGEGDRLLVQGTFEVLNDLRGRLDDIRECGIVPP